MENLIGKVVDLVNDLHDLTENKHFYVRVENHCKTVHVADLELFFKSFSTFDCKEIGISNYKYEVFNDVEGIHFFTILKQEDYEKYVLKQGKKNTSA